MTRIFYTTDIHGSEKCFKKFVNAGKFYNADVIIFGGDITGKLIIPIIGQSRGSYQAEFMGRIEKASTEEELRQLQEKVRVQGFYPYVTSDEEFRELSADREKIDKLFSDLMARTLEEWVRFAEERLSKSKTRCFITPGNDDRFEIDDILAASKVVANPEGRVISIDEDHEMVSTGFSNLTPWRCPRDVTEEELEERIERMFHQVRDPKNCIFNSHVPPFGTKLDVAPKLDENYKMVITMGNPEMTSAGSLAVRKAIEKYQPLLGLHGHIHESKNVDRIGRTLIINPGSEYSEGILHGALVDLDQKKIKSYLLVEG
jgi:Icc-related predicted phosphoesterase